MPGERLERGIQSIYVLGEHEGLILRASESFKDGVSENKALLQGFSILHYFAQTL